MALCNASRDKCMSSSGISSKSLGEWFSERKYLRLLCCFARKLFTCWWMFLSIFWQETGHDKDLQRNLFGHWNILLRKFTYFKVFRLSLTLDRSLSCFEDGFSLRFARATIAQNTADFHTENWEDLFQPQSGQFSPAGQSQIQPFLEPFERNLGHKSYIKRLFQPRVGPIPAQGPNQP